MFAHRPSASPAPRPRTPQDKRQKTAPFTKLLTDLAYAEFGTTALVPLLGPAQGQQGPRVVVIIDPSEREAYAAQMADRRLSAFLVRPVRPVSALTQLFAPRDVDTNPVHRLGALTANAYAEDRESYLAAGLDDYLAKPFEKRDLEELIARWQNAAAAAEAGAA